MAAEQSSSIPHIDSHNMAMLQAVGTLVNDKPVHHFTIPEQRELFHDLQANPRKRSGVAVSHSSVKTPYGEVKTFIYKPELSQVDVPFVFYVHGGGWCFGSAADFEAFLFDLVGRTGLAFVFPEYSLAPDKRFPTQIEQCLAVLQDILKNGHERGLLVNQVALAGDSAGSQLTCALSILNHQRSLGLPIVHQLLLNPLVDATSPFSSGIFWNPDWAEQQRAAYFSTAEDRSGILASPGLMTIDQAKDYMPSTTIITSEHDGFKPEGEAFAKLLQTAGVSCGHLQAMASLHAFEIFNQSRGSPTADMVMTAISAKLRDSLTEKSDRARR